MPPLLRGAPPLLLKAQSDRRLFTQAICAELPGLDVESARRACADWAVAFGKAARDLSFVAPCDARHLEAKLQVRRPPLASP